MRRASLRLTLACSLAACGGPLIAPPRYAQLPAPRAVPSITPARSLLPIALACDSAESASPNAVDDDCDGRIDDAPPHAALIVALAFATPAELELSLVDSAGKAIEPSTSRAPSACGSTSGAASALFSYLALPRGTAEIVVRHRGTCGEPHEPVTLAVSFGTGERASAYLTTLAKSQELVLGRVNVP